MSATLLLLHAEAALVDAFRVHAPQAEVVCCDTPAAVIEACATVEPDCVVVAAGSDEEVRLLVSSIRIQPSCGSAVPVVVLCDDNTEAARLELFRSGADLVLSWPMSPAELVARLDALIGLARRLSEPIASSSTRSVGLPPTPRTMVAIDVTKCSSGDVGETTVATLLALIQAKQASGLLSIGRSQAARQRLVVEILNGEVVSGTASGKRLSAEDATDAALRWSAGHYDFAPASELGVDSESATPRRPPERAPSRPSMGWKPHPDQQRSVPTPRQPIRRVTLQSHVAIRQPGEANPRKPQVVTVETPNEIVNETPNIASAAPEPTPPPRRRT